MNLSPTIQDALNKQLKAELFSSHLYLGLENYFDGLGLKGFAHWMRKHADEERGHALTFLAFIRDRQGTPVIPALEAPQQGWGSPQEAVTAAFNHEKAVTEMIHALYELAKKEGDNATAVFLHTFVDEQVEEEALFDDVVKRTALAGTGSGLLVLDQELGKRE